MLEDLSRYSLKITEELTSNQDLLKLITYYDTLPYTHPNVKNISDNILFKTIMVTPFSNDVPKYESVNVRAYFDEGFIERDKLSDNVIYFEIVIHKNLWLIRDKEDNMAFRPYEIMSKIEEIFHRKRIAGLGVLHLKSYRYHHINESWGIYRIPAKIWSN